MIGASFFKQLIVRKLQEPTTYSGLLTMLAAACHFALPPEIRDAATTICVFVAGLLLVPANESRKPSGGPLGVAPPSPAAGDPAPGSIERVPVDPKADAAVRADQVHAESRPHLRPDPVSRDNAIGPG